MNRSIWINCIHSECSILQIDKCVFLSTSNRTKLFSYWNKVIKIKRNVIPWFSECLWAPYYLVFRCQVFGAHCFSDWSPVWSPVSNQPGMPRSDYFTLSHHLLLAASCVTVAMLLVSLLCLLVREFRPGFPFTSRGHGVKLITVRPMIGANRIHVVWGYILT